jgi:hypothetical protein
MGPKGSLSNRNWGSRVPFSQHCLNKPNVCPVVSAQRKGPGRGPEVDPNEAHKSPASPNRQSTRFPRRWQVPARRPARLWAGRALG